MRGLVKMIVFIPVATLTLVAAVVVGAAIWAEEEMRRVRSAIHQHL